MSQSDAIPQLVLQFLMLSLVAVGGANAVIPEMHRQVVEVRGWMTGADFVALFAIAQAAPGPNMLIVSLVGWKVAGIPGALAATAAMCGPSSILAFFVGRLAHRFQHSPVRAIIQNGLGPITIGIVLAGGFLLARTAGHTWASYGVTAATVALMLKTRLNPLWLLAGGALLGIVGVVPPGG
ncbi:MAG TPA: chromate transporter [Burkholderiales bacterium]|nr:chromate transporter [Burkholderiales bacterium]